MTLSGKLTAALNAQERNAPWLAEKCGLMDGAVSRIVDGQRRRLLSPEREDVCMKFAVALRLPYEWLLDDTDNRPYAQARRDYARNHVCPTCYRKPQEMPRELSPL